MTMSHEPPAWLHESVYRPRRERSVRLVKQAVDLLVAERKQNPGIRVSYASIVAKTKEIDPDGRGVSENTIRNNEEAHNYYEAHKTHVGPRTQAQRRRIIVETINLDIKQDRDVKRARQRYMKMPKADLVDRLLAVEQAYGAQQAEWIRLNDELLTLQLKEASL